MIAGIGVNATAETQLSMTLILRLDNNTTGGDLAVIYLAQIPQLINI
jgi:hypothetical protein